MSVQVKTPTKTNFDRVEMHHSFSSPEVPARRTRDDAAIKNETKFSQPWGRKRRFSQSYRKEEGAQRRKRLKSTPAGPLPNRFLNGGSIDDPLNLNSLDSSELGRQLNSVTPQSSPLPIPTRRQSVEVRIPFNVTDPLNLNDSDEEADLEKLLKKKQKRNRHKKKEDSLVFSPPSIVSKDRSLMEALKIDIEPEQSTSDAAKQKEAFQKQRTSSFSNKIVSPVIPQISPKCKKRRRTNSGCKPEPIQAGARSHSTGNQPSTQDKKSPHSPKKFRHPKPVQKKNDKTCNSASGKARQKFIYGNYNRYYGYRNPTLEDDKRLKSFKSEWFEGKSVLDIGCNVGHLTLSLAQLFLPSKIVGIDIDPKLIAVARKNIRFYMSAEVADTTKFPISNMLNYGPIVAPPVSKDASRLPEFPHNVLFKQGNYVLECDELLDLQKEEYDVVLALSVTKWIHFNWGDAGLKRFFKRVYKQLRPGGRFILEPQPWSSYKKKKKLTEEIHGNFKQIRLRPEQFTDYLLSRDVGFNTCNTLDLPYNASKGFRRAILMFTKSDTIQNSPWSEIGNATPVPCLLASIATPHTPATPATPATPFSSYSYTEDSCSSSSSDSLSCASSCSSICCVKNAPTSMTNFADTPDRSNDAATDEPKLGDMLLERETIDIDSKDSTNDSTDLGIKSKVSSSVVIHEDKDAMDCEDIDTEVEAVGDVTNAVDKDLNETCEQKVDFRAIEDLEDGNDNGKCSITVTTTDGDRATSNQEDVHQKHENTCSKQDGGEKKQISDSSNDKSEDLETKSEIKTKEK